jgi:hypothetical protein
VSTSEYEPDGAADVDPIQRGRLGCDGRGAQMATAVGLAGASQLASVVALAAGLMPSPPLVRDSARARARLLASAVARAVARKRTSRAMAMLTAAARLPRP